jgi:hypothetical protein
MKVSLEHCHGHRRSAASATKIAILLALVTEVARSQPVQLSRDFIHGAPVTDR